MASSKRLRLRDYRSLYQLLGECSELGGDPHAWRLHLTEQLIRAFNGQIANFFEVKVAAQPFEDRFWLQPLMAVDLGWATDSDRRPFEAHLQGGRPEDGPHITPDLLHRRFKVVQWCRNPSEPLWYQSQFYNEHIKPSYLDDGLFAHQMIEPGHFRWMIVSRAIGDRPFNRRERRMMCLLNYELARIYGPRLAPLGGPTLHDLSPRQRDVLVCLLEGDSENQAAKRLGISRHTVHDYVKALHAYFGVRSRGELLAHCRSFLRGASLESVLRTYGDETHHRHVALNLDELLGTGERKG